MTLSSLLDLSGYLPLSVRRLVLRQQNRAKEFVRKAETDPTFKLLKYWIMVRIAVLILRLLLLREEGLRQCQPELVQMVQQHCLV